MKLGLLFILATSLLNFTNDDSVTQSKLSGKWVDVNTKTDTLTILVLSNHDYVQLDRGREIRNGVLIPKQGAGPYNYKVMPRKISLCWVSSSNANYNDYYFNQAGDSLVIGNFYDTFLKGAMQTFKKLK